VAVAPPTVENVEQSSVKKTAASGSLAKMFAAKSVPQSGETESAIRGSAAMASLFANHGAG
jgi:hypothetical protein